jgi:sulfatase maturation enzyme AslB (radical SAM superfamily)
MGNILKDDWSSIWDGDYAKNIRDGKFLSRDCDGCEHIASCNGACHLNRSSEVIRTGKKISLSYFFQVNIVQVVKKKGLRGQTMSSHFLSE